jgi:dsDNA-specific endonuclease/ATPase MutS2
MLMSEKNSDVNKIKEAESFPETGHFYLAQQINFLSQQISWQHDRINTIDNKFEQKIDALDKKFEQKIDALDKKFEQKIDALDKKFEQKIDALDKKFEQKIETLDKKIDDRFKWLLGITVASWITIIASVLASIFVR